MTRIRTAIVGCGSVSQPYLQDLSVSPHVELVAVADVVPARAADRAAEFHIPQHYADVESLLAGAEFDLLINLTAMQRHYEINRKALEAGRHVLSEKPLAGSREQGRALIGLARERGVQLFGAPNVVASPAFRHMAQVVASGRIGRVCQARARYGHGGPSWGPWFYAKGGGALFDLGVYNITFLTGVLGPVHTVSALAGTAIREREVEGQRIRAEADDNTVLLLDHGNAVYSTVATGFVFGPHREERTIEFTGTRGAANLLGWDWHPLGVEVRAEGMDDWAVECADQQGYDWSRAGSLVAECLATGRPCPMTIEQAYHVLDVMLGALESAATGRHVAVESRFAWPLIPVPAAGVEAAAPAAGEAAPTGLDADKHNR